MEIPAKHCGQCALRSPSQKKCQLTGWTYEDKDPACKNFCVHLTQCGICGRGFPSLKIVIDDYLVCGECAEKTGTCHLCESRFECDFETNPSTLPKVVQKVIQQGNMQMATQIRNPEREKITCAAGCKCYNETYGCSRQDNVCINYEFRRNRQNS